MKVFNKLIFSGILAFMSVLTIQADEPILSPDQAYRYYIRGYMAQNRFFDRLIRQENYIGMPLSEQVLADKKTTENALKSIQREYPLYDSIPYLVSSGVILAGFYTALKFQDEISAFTKANGALGLVSFIAVSSLLPFSIISTYYALSANVYYSMFLPYLPEKDVIIAYGSKKNFLKKSTQNYIEEELFYSYWRSPSSEGLYRLQKSLDKALRLPFYSKELVFDEKLAERVFKNYSQPTKKRLSRFARSEIIYQQSDAKVKDSHHAVYFQGLPGTGKTHAAKLLAETMGTNLALITLDGASIDDIVGTSFESAEAKAGRIIDAMIANTESSQDINHYNQILLIDEFDRLFLSDNDKAKEILPFFQKLLDPADRSFYSPYLKTKIRLPDTIILAGNYDIHELSRNNIALDAIASRIEKIEFSGYDYESKKNIAITELIPNKEKRIQSIGNRAYKDFKLPESDYELIFDFIKRDTDPGLRSVERYISEVIENYLLKD